MRESALQGTPSWTSLALGGELRELVVDLLQGRFARGQLVGHAALILLQHFDAGDHRCALLGQDLFLVGHGFFLSLTRYLLESSGLISNPLILSPLPRWISTIFPFDSGLWTWASTWVSPWFTTTLGAAGAAT